MSILIKGVDMPIGGNLEITICRDGRCFVNGVVNKSGAVEVKTPHGRLIDADEVLAAMDTWDKFGFTHTGAFVREPISSDYVPYVHYEDMVKCVEGMSAVIESED